MKLKTLIATMVAILGLTVFGYFLGYSATLDALQITNAEDRTVEITDQFGESWVYSYE